MKNEDEIMADHLLRGGKMLARACPDCGCPLFEMKGETSCVVCTARQAEQPAEAPETVMAAPTTTTAPKESGDARMHGPLDDELRTTLACLLERVRAEPDPERCRTLMKCVAAGWELLG